MLSERPHESLPIPSARDTRSLAERAKIIVDASERSQTNVYIAKRQITRGEFLIYPASRSRSTGPSAPLYDFNRQHPVIKNNNTLRIDSDYAVSL